MPIWKIFLVFAAERALAVTNVAVVIDSIGNVVRRDDMRHALSSQATSVDLQRRFGRRQPPAGFLPGQELPDDTYYNELRRLILSSCGQACEFVGSSGKGRFFDTVVKQDQCKSLFTADMTLLDGLSNRWPPPRQIPEAMRMDFLMGNASLNFEDSYRQESAENLPMSWTAEFINGYREKFNAANFDAGYGAFETTMIRNLIMKYRAELEGKRCAVLGSQSPWLEVLLLQAGVAHVTTIEYSDIKSTEPKIETMHPSDWASWYEKNHETGLFDCVASYSSLEHAGLGRYGDIVNPWGDLIAMGKLTCSTKPNGLVFIGYPSPGEDGLAWNSHRYYGAKRWAQMLANTEQLEYEHPAQASFHQGMVVARKRDL
eukprot:TRINITY_DN47057_c0_g1_i1.p1 TRINITY_DN47057_c0_g1~~TRINITY_DN47057_c0_g1_i1.p1  ORF type:complete len:372 (-),score=50.49 TRINITY_DN47057_c0_g1_i1:108-1223(-)